jgi:hypothetical protein
MKQPEVSGGDGHESNYMSKGKICSSGMKVQFEHF